MADLKTAMVNEPMSIDEKKVDQNRDSGDISSGQDDIPGDSKKEKLLTAKIDLKVLPVCGLIFLICFLDRTNIAKCKTCRPGRRAQHAFEWI